MSKSKAFGLELEILYRFQDEFGGQVKAYRYMKEEKKDEIVFWCVKDETPEGCDKKLTMRHEDFLDMVEKLGWKQLN